MRVLDVVGGFTRHRLDARPHLRFADQPAQYAAFDTKSRGRDLLDSGSKATPHVRDIDGASPCAPARRCIILQQPGTDQTGNAAVLRVRNRLAVSPHDPAAQPLPTCPGMHGHAVMRIEPQSIRLARRRSCLSRGRRQSRHRHHSNRNHPDHLHPILFVATTICIAEWPGSQRNLKSL